MAWLQILSLFYLSFLVSLVLGLIEGSSGKALAGAVWRRFWKLLAGLFVIGLCVQVLTWIGG
jgi:hypothetical protein